MNLVFKINIQNEMDLHLAIHKSAMEYQKQKEDVVKMAMLKTVISELGHNILKYAKSGTICTQIEGSPKKLIIVASDKGPGIGNIEKALEDNYSSSGTLGLGLPGVKRMVDEFSIQSELGKGTTVSIAFYL